MEKYKLLKDLPNAKAGDIFELKDNGYWCIGTEGTLIYRGFAMSAKNGTDDKREEIGNYFETREEAEKAAEKLKAWKRLKDKGFQITGWDNSIGDDYYKTGQIVLNLNNVKNTEWDEYERIGEIKNDLDLLFGGEE